MTPDPYELRFRIYPGRPAFPSVAESKLPTRADDGGLSGDVGEIRALPALSRFVRLVGGRIAGVEVVRFEELDGNFDGKRKKLDVLPASFEEESRGDEGESGEGEVCILHWEGVGGGVSCRGKAVVLVGDVEATAAPGKVVESGVLEDEALERGNGFTEP